MLLNTNYIIIATFLAWHTFITGFYSKDFTIIFTDDKIVSQIILSLPDRQ